MRECFRYLTRSERLWLDDHGRGHRKEKGREETQWSWDGRDAFDGADAQAVIAGAVENGDSEIVLMARVVHDEEETIPCGEDTVRYGFNKIGLSGELAGISEETPARPLKHSKYLPILFWQDSNF
jgi:hypothetical protein